jgi:hypothetical protein
MTIILHVRINLLIPLTSSLVYDSLAQLHSGNLEVLKLDQMCVMGVGYIWA